MPDNRISASLSQALTVAEQNEDILPRSFDVAEMRKDVDLLDAHAPIMASLSQLTELVEDTLLRSLTESFGAMSRSSLINTRASISAWHEAKS